MGIIIHILTDLGARIGEITSLTKSRIDLRRKQVTLDGKTGKRTVAYPAVGHSVFKQLKDGVSASEGRVFQKKPNSLRAMVNRRLKKLTKELGVPYFSSNGFRWPHPRCCWRRCRWNGFWHDLPPRLWQHL